MQPVGHQPVEDRPRGGGGRGEHRGVGASSVLEDVLSADAVDEQRDYCDSDDESGHRSQAAHTAVQ
ncbi:hypothetical protein [Natronorubrum sp. DTA7]|uniref:hypothetical protein n=1 Tax=Natronorubrum sp. DTA7 TaxID=3447016 RepID=UPI003F85C08D